MFPFLDIYQSCALARCNVNDRLSFRAEAEMHSSKKPSRVLGRNILSFTGQNMEFVGLKSMSIGNILGGVSIPCIRADCLLLTLSPSLLLLSWLQRQPLFSPDSGLISRAALRAPWEMFAKIWIRTLFIDNRPSSMESGPQSSEFSTVKQFTGPRVRAVIHGETWHPWIPFINDSYATGDG